MSGGAFRDASAAMERAAILEQENEQLRRELADMARLRVEVEELEKLRAEVEELRAIARSENEGAYVKRLGEERDELANEVRALRERVASQQQTLWMHERRRGNVVEPALEAFEKLIRLFRPK